jgi:hypothetical protein
VRQLHQGLRGGEPCLGAEDSGRPLCHRTGLTRRVPSLEPQALHLSGDTRGHLAGAAARNPNRRLYFHGMLTYDYFSVLKTVRDKDGNWLDPMDWTEVRFPLALVVFGEVAQEEDEEHC